MIKYIIGAVVGGGVGYFVLYKVIGCANGSCAITSNPYISTIYGVVIGLLIAGIITIPNTSKNETTSTTTEYKKITAAQAKDMIDNSNDVIIVDVRTEAEFLSSHIPNAILIPNEAIGNQRPTELPDLNAKILVYCRSGNRSAQAARKLISLGYTNVYDFGGIIDWDYETVPGAAD